MRLLQPDKCFSSITSIDIEWDLVRLHLRSALLDVDNTIRRRDNDEVPLAVRAWLARARDAGVSLCLLSNNFHDNVFALASELGLPIVAKAMKPLPLGYRRALRLLDARADETVMIGDQLLTDVAGAHALGMKAYLVAPLVDVDLKHTLVLRRIEERLLRGTVPGKEGTEEGGAVPDGAVVSKEGLLE